MKAWVKANLLFVLLIWLVLKNSPALGYAKKIRVLIHPDQDHISVNAFDKVKAFNYRNRKFIRIFPEGIPITCRSSPLGIEIGEHDIKTDLILLATYNQSALRVEDRWYRGEIIIHKKKNFRLEIINELDLELYLQGIMKQEISPQWPEAALKAQAIVARSYALFEKQRNLDSLYDLKSTTESQAYLGIDGEDPLTNQAIEDTRDLILTVDGKPLSAFYHACCGGHTGSAHNIFGDYPAIPGVVCTFCQDSPYYTWEVPFSNIQVRNYLLRSEIKVSPIKSIYPIGKTSSRRIRELKIKHELESIRITGKKFRRMIGYNQLPSLLFTIEEIQEKDDEEGEEGEEGKKKKKQKDYGLEKTFNFIGRGWGHGVGLCQWGSKKMAEEGSSYEEILHKYYPLATLSRAK